MKRATCTIVSLNYFSYARVLCDSFLQHHPDCDFYVLLVDRIPLDLDLSREQCRVVPVEALGISDFRSIAFKYDILELNTNVKPTFLKWLFAQGYDQVVYLDPDIFVYRRLNSVFEALDRSTIVITPHCLSPIDRDVPSEAVLLKGGVFNLGFIAVSKCEEAGRFLDWWERRCLEFAFNEPSKGIFVDQKWINLVPCFFENVTVLKDPGCNMAWWNLHERELSLASGGLIVNGSTPLEFFHFSGISMDSGDKLSRRNSPYTLANRPDISSLYEEYRGRLTEAGIREFKARPYAFQRFDDGQYINRLTRSLYAANLQQYKGEDPFSSSSRFYRWARSAGLFSAGESASAYNSETYVKSDVRLRILRALFRLALRILGAERYTLLLKYLSWVSIPHNQTEIFPIQG
jgi:hypothetical protein